MKDGSSKDFNECITCSRSPDHCDYTPEILGAIRSGLRTTVSTDLSVTRILGEPRQRIIETKYKYRVLPRRNWVALRGTIIHAVLERGAHKSAMTEVSDFRNLHINGEELPLWGKCDLLVPIAKLICDYKSVARIPSADNPKSYGTHDLQLNAYRWLWTPHYEIDKLRLVYLDMQDVRRVKVELMPLDEVENTLIQKASAFLKPLRAGVIPSDEYSSKKWQCRYCDVSDICKELNREGK